ncbi:MAG: VirE protein, partial [Bacteroidaceae bacterium]|nr:VirE protein [Bacteroidaceae bacterium]
MFGIGYNIKSKVRECTPELLDKVLDSSSVAKTCAELEDALERCRRGELTKEEYETLKGELKKLLPVATFHATFKHGRRKNHEAIPSGLSIYDIDHIPNPRAKWAEIEPRKEELGIVMAHITPSTEGLRLVFVVPRGMSLAEAQAWMASMLGDTTYDVCVKDYARCSFLVPREYVLFLSERLFDSPCHPLPSCHPERSEGSEDINVDSGCTQILRDAQDDKTGSDAQDDKPTYPETYEGIPYPKIVETLEEQMGGRPEHGSRNNFIFSMACHLRYICDDDPDWIATILPTYGEAREKWMASIRSACARNQTRSFPNIMRRTLKIAQSGCTQILRDAQNDTGVALPP